MNKTCRSFYKRNEEKNSSTIMSWNNDANKPKKWMANELDDDSLNKKEKDSSIERKKLNLKNKIAKPKKDAYIMANKQTNQRKKKNRNKYER